MLSLLLQHSTTHCSLMMGVPRPTATWTGRIQHVHVYLLPTPSVYTSLHITSFPPSASPPSILPSHDLLLSLCLSSSPPSLPIIIYFVPFPFPFSAFPPPYHYISPSFPLPNLILGATDGVSYHVRDTAGHVLTDTGPHQVGLAAQTML